MVGEWIVIPGAWKSRHAGVTLIELLVTVAIVGIIGAVAYPSYVSQVQRSRRTDAKVALVTVAQGMERFYTENNTYTGATLGGTNSIYPAVSPNGFYTLTLTLNRSNALPAGTSYLLQAVPAGSQAADTTCGTFSLDETGAQTVTGTAAAATCWGG